jgi:hypothetical protein
LLSNFFFFDISWISKPENKCQQFRINKLISRVASRLHYISTSNV